MKEDVSPWTVTRQLVLTEKTQPPEIKLAVPVLLSRTRSARFLGSQFRETGIGVVVTTKHIYLSSTVTSNARNHLDNDAVFSCQSELLKAIRANEGENYKILRSSFLHTHPGKGTPLNMGDERSFDEGAGRVFFDSLSEKGTVVSLYAVPDEDRGALVFAFVK